MTKQNGKTPRTKIKSTVSKPSTDLGQVEDGSRPIPDLSLLRQPIQTSITGFIQARDVFDTGTEELKQLLSKECDVIYECRVCRNLFRSLANFISHKRVYCHQKFNTSLHAHFINNKYQKDDIKIVLQNEEDYQHFVKTKNRSANNPKIAKKPAAKDLTSIIERLATEKSKSQMKEGGVGPPPERLIQLESISSSASAVYQNLCTSKNDLCNLIKEQVNELDMMSSCEAILGPDGKLLISSSTLAKPGSIDTVIQISDEEDDTKEIVCKICKIKFSTIKTLKFHMKYKHAPNRLVFPCPDCTESFANAWGVYRHLFKVHRKSLAHIRKLRESIQTKAYRLDNSKENEKIAETTEVTETISEQHRMDLENQAWMDNLEGDGEVPRCGGCGRRFERRAALSSHRQTCQLRIAAHNKISTNMQRRTAAKAAKELDAPKADMEPRVKIPKIDVKPSEKTIEIQIRHDYNKGLSASPISLGTSSPLSETAGEGEGLLVQQCLGESAGKGENSDCLNVNSIINVPDENISDHSNLFVTVKDCDDAYVNADVDSSDPLYLDVNVLDTSVHSDAVVKNIKKAPEVEMTIIDDSDLSFEDIKRICHTNTPKTNIKSTLGDEMTVIVSNDEKTENANSKSASCKSFTLESKNANLDKHKSVDDTVKNKIDPFDVVIGKCNQSDNTTKIVNSSIDSNRLIDIENMSALDARIKTVCSEKLFCKECDIVFLSISAFRKHMAKHFDWKRFKCKLCHFKSYSQNHCVNHLKYQHKLSGDAPRLKTFIRWLSPAEACSVVSSNSSVSIIPLNESSNTDCLNLSDEDTESNEEVVKNIQRKRKIIEIESTPTKRGDKDNSLEMPSPANSSSSANDGTSRKRGRPKGTFKSLKRKQVDVEQDSSKSKHSTSKKFKDKTSTSAEKKKSPVKDIIIKATSAGPSLDLSEWKRSTSRSSMKLPSAILDPVSGDIEYEEKWKRRSFNIEHTASFASSTVKRPIRNRVKPLNKDFEYDLSNLLKLEAEAYKESQMTSNVSQKTQLKRKPLLQNEITPVDQPIETGGAKDQENPKVAKASKSPNKSYHGALQSASLKAAQQSKAFMKQTVSITARRDLPPFISQRSRSQLAESSLVAKSPPPSSPTKSSAKTPPVMTAEMITTQSQNTHSTTSERLSSDKYPRKTATPTLSTPLTLTMSSIETTPKSYPSKKRLNMVVPNLIQRSVRNKSKSDDVITSPYVKSDENILDDSSADDDVLILTPKNHSEMENSLISLSSHSSLEMNASITDREPGDTKHVKNLKRDDSPSDSPTDISAAESTKSISPKERNADGSMKVRGAKIIKFNMAQKKELNVAELKNKLSHYLTQSQCKNASNEESVEEKSPIDENHH